MRTGSAREGAWKNRRDRPALNRPKASVGAPQCNDNAPAQQDIGECRHATDAVAMVEQHERFLRVWQDMDRVVVFDLPPGSGLTGQTS
jgi:hypothetical protein